MSKFLKANFNLQSIWANFVRKALQEFLNPSYMIINTNLNIGPG